MTGKKVQIADRTTETATFWALPSGAIEAEVHAAPVRVRDAKNGWRPVDLTLVRKADGSVTAAAHPAGLRLAGKAGAGRHDLVQVGQGDQAATMTWTGPLPEPVLDGPKATYAQVRPGVDLVVEATRTGFEQFLVVHGSAAVAQVRSVPLSLSSKGLRFEPDRRGGLLLKDRRSGARVGASPAPQMWDAQRRVGSDEPARVAAVKARSTARSGGRTDLVLTPDVAWLTSPATKYPVTIDPSIVLSAGFDTFVQSNVTDDSSAQGILKIGTQDGGTVVSRSFVAFPGLDWLWGKQVQSATLRLWNELSTSCTPAEWQAWRVGPVTSAVRWSAQPAWLAQVGASTETKGFSAACADGWVGVPVTGALQHLATGGTDSTAHLGLRATSETDSNGWKRFDSTEAANPPHIQLTYHTAPSVTAMATNPWAPCTTGSGRPYLASATPRLRAQVTDPDAAPVQARFEWWAVGGSAAIGSATAAAGPSGSWRVVDVPSAVLANGGSYQWRAQGYDGTAWGAWSSWCEFTVDTTVPGTMPTVTSTDYPAAPPTPAGGAHTAGTFTFGAAGVTDVAAYLYGLDTNPPTKRIAPATLGGSVNVSVTPKTDGPHVLYVRSRDRAGNLSPVRAYSFLVGPGGIVTPAEGDVTAAKVNLTVQGHPTSTGVRYQWRRAETDAWVNIPLTHVTYTAGGGAVASWPVASTGTGAYPAITWDVAATLAAADAASVARDGPLYLRAVFAGLTAANSVEIAFDRDRATADTAGVGPGEVNLVTGNYVVAQGDVNVKGLSVSRAYNTRQATAFDAMFGPGWASGLAGGEASVPYTQLNVYGSLVQVGLPDDTTLGFTQKTTTAAGATFEPPPNFSRLSLAYSTSSDSYTLTEGDGNATTFTRQASDPAGQYMPTSITPPGSGETTTYSWQKVTVDTRTVMRPTRLLAPVPAGVTCGTTLVRGCRALSFTYATSTTATGTAESGWGDYTGRLKEISYTAWDPDLATPAMRTVAVSRYAYDNTGKLRASWDPRLDWLDGSVTRRLWHRYAYDGDGILTTITPPGEEPWQLTYTTLPTDPGKGRLYKVTRSALSAGTAVNTVVYKVPVSGAPYDMSAAQTARWGQAAPPVDATAVFPPTQVPTGNPATGTLPSSYERATVNYLNANARTVNTVVPGGHTATTWFDDQGNVVRELSAANRSRALGDSPSDSVQAEATLAEALSDVRVYSSDGVRLVDELGPEHDVVLPDNSVVRGRTHKTYTYDEGLPAATTPPNLVTTRTTTVQLGDGADTDARTTTTQYDWTLRQPTVEIVDPSGLNLRTRMSYDSAGRITATTTPAGGSVDTTPSTRATVYYTTAANSTYPECGNRAEWAGNPCRTHPGGQPATGPELLATVTTYDMYGQPRAHTEKNSAGVQRTTTIIYDAAGRPYETVVTAASGLGEPLERRRNLYEAATGYLTRTQTVSSGGTVTAQVIRVYDTLGRLVSYTDADGNVATTTYDVMSRIATEYDGKATQTYTYDGGSERRGLPTQLVDSQAGTFTAQHDADGKVVSQLWPNGVATALASDETGAAISIAYTYPACGGSDCTLYHQSATANAHGQVRVRTSTLSSQGLGYDQAGRLTSVRDAVGGAGCVTRVYSYSTASDRSGLSTYGPGGSGACQTTAASSNTTWTYDTANRVTTSGTAYDALGRTTSVASADLAGNGGTASVSYHVDDTVRRISQGATETTYAPDVLTKRIRNEQVDDGTSTTTKVLHYSDDTDRPVWTNEGGWYTRTVPGLLGVAGLFTGVQGHMEWKITNLHSDFVATILDPSAGLATVHEPDEHGVSRTGGTLDQRYGYLGMAQRKSDNPAGLVTMGVRLYNPGTNRFLSTDPVYGGNANPYDYCAGDSVNCTDTTGAISCPQTGYKRTTRWGIPYKWEWWFTCYLSHAESLALIKGDELSGVFWGAYSAIRKATKKTIIGAALVAALGIIADWAYGSYCTRNRGMWFKLYVVINLKKVIPAGVWINGIGCR